MKAPAFEYLKAATLAEALSALSEHGDGAKVLAGGQSLVPALNLRLLAPAILIDINGLTELAGIELRGDRLHIGALTRHAEIGRSALVREHAPLLFDAIPYLSHPAIRNRGTIGGNLAQADPASELPACAVALQAEIVVAGPSGERRVKAGDFFTGVYETALQPDEILTAVEVPVARAGQRHAFLELARRSGDYALVGIACTAEVTDGRFTAVRPVFFAAGPHPLVAHEAASRLLGREADEAALAAAAAALSADLSPEADLQITAAVRLHLARTLLRRAVATLLGGGSAATAGQIAA